MFRCLPILATMALLTVVTPATASQPVDSTKICRDLIAEAEVRHRLPKLLMSAISLAESGRWNEQRKATIAWPWTVYAEGRGRYLPSKAAALAEVRELRRQGVRNIDVGCTQVNLHFHGDAFATLEEALDPARNIDFAARFLRKLHRETRSWSMAAGYYHSRTAKLNRPYRGRVLKHWSNERRRVAEERRQAARAAFLDRRAAWQEGQKGG
ncbi:MAG: hypothetical protein MI806_13400 [Minwuiales bacterium]|nr:hypothetical protein [Minwuiales bacterium]